MNKELIKYVKYGIWNDVLYYPYNKRTIINYIQELKPLEKIILDENENILLKMLEQEDSNIFIISYILGILGLNETNYNIILNKIKNKKDLYIFITFQQILSKKTNKKMINQLYKDKYYIIGDYKKIIFNNIQPNIKNRIFFYKRNKEVQRIQNKMDDGTIEPIDVNIIKELKIHPSEIKNQMSYYFNEDIKTEIIKYYLEQYDVVEIFPYVEIWFFDSIPNEVLNILNKKLYNVTEIANIIELLIFYKKTNDSYLLNILEKLFEHYSPNKRHNNISISIIPTLKNRYKIDEREEYDYMYLVSIISALLTKEFNTTLYINNIRYKNDIFLSLINSIENANIYLKPNIKNMENDKINILFSTNYNNNYDIIWNVASEENIKFEKHNNLLLIKGRNIYLLQSLIKYINFEGDKYERKQ